jgi:uncharacterized protein YbcI
MKTRGEIEAAISKGVTIFMQEFMGRGPKDICTHLIGDILLVRLHGVLTAAERHLVTSSPADKGRNLLKDVRTHLVEVSRTRLEKMIEESSGMHCISLHHDVSSVTGEEVFLFTLSHIPDTRTVKTKQ